MASGYCTGQQRQEHFHHHTKFYWTVLSPMVRRATLPASVCPHSGICMEQVISFSPYCLTVGQELFSGNLNLWKICNLHKVTQFVMVIIYHV